MTLDEATFLFYCISTSLDTAFDVIVVIMDFKVLLFRKLRTIVEPNKETNHLINHLT